MFPDRPLTLLAARKVALQRNISVHRAQCAVAAARVARPLKALDRTLVLWRRSRPLARFAALPLGLLLKSSSLPRTRVLGTLLRWGPLVFGAVRSFAGSRRR
jgi:hypothetical protein